MFLIIFLKALIVVVITILFYGVIKALIGAK